MVIVGLYFLLNDLLSFGGDSFEIGRPRLRGWKNFGRRWTRRGEGMGGGRGGGVLKIGEFWTIFMTSYMYHP